MKDFEDKLERMQCFLRKNKYNGMIIGRRDNFSWLTGGVESGVVLNRELGFVYLVITKERRWAVAMRADMKKAMKEQLKELGFEACEIDWKSPGMEEQAIQLAGRGNIVSDFAIEGAVMDLEGIYHLEYPMTETEVGRYREFGKICDRILKDTADQIVCGMTENEIRKIFVCQCVQEDIDIDVLLIGSDERISNYRHCTPTEKRIKKTVLLSPALRKGGLHANLARMISIGEPDEEVRKKYDDVCEIQAEILTASRQGVKFTDIMRLQERLYVEKGYQEDWMMHLHGAPIGYMLTDGTVMFDKAEMMQVNQAYEWYVTVTGAKSAELVMNIDDQIEILSAAGYWPMKAYKGKQKDIFLPDIYVV